VLAQTLAIAVLLASRWICALGEVRAKYRLSAVDSPHSEAMRTGFPLTQERARVSVSARPGFVLSPSSVLRALGALLLCLPLAAPVLAQGDAAPAAPQAAQVAPDREPDPQTGQVTGVRVSATVDRARLIVDLSRTTEFAIATLADPPRIAIDVRMPGVAVLAPPPVAGEGLVTGYAISQFDVDRVRTLLDLSGPAQVQQAYVLDAVADQPARLVVDIIPDTAEAFATRAAAHLAASQAVQVSEDQSADQAAGASSDADAAAVPLPELGLRSSVPAAAPPATVSTSDVRPLVIIDPGHGGIDNGATAPNGVREKNIVLAYAKQLQDLLISSGRFDVALTREDDIYLRLEERVAMARQNKADLFISLHADSFQQPEIRGASVYTRDERATDVLDKVLAESENKRDIIAGFAMPEMTPQVVDILVDLMRREMRRQSYLAAEAIVHQLEPSVTLRRFPVRQADFFVLQAPDVPSVLVELGFLSNAADIQNLLTDGWRDRVVDALARGIAHYFDTLETPTP
jgi:N-acetylmuramoyl-L-alanine amidase